MTGLKRKEPPDGSIALSKANTLTPGRIIKGGSVLDLALTKIFLETNNWIYDELKNICKSLGLVIKCNKMEVTDEVTPESKETADIKADAKVERMKVGRKVTLLLLHVQAVLDSIVLISQAIQKKRASIYSFNYI